MTSNLNGTTRTGSRFPLWGGPLILAVVIGALFTAGMLPRLNQKRKLVEMTQLADNSVPVVTVAKVEAGTAGDLNLPGNLLPIQEVPIQARAGGYLVKRLVDIGAHVRAGQLLAVVSAPDLDAQALQAAAQADQSKAVVSQSTAGVQQLRAQEEQATAGVVHQQAAVKQAAAQYEASKSQVLQAKSALSVAQANLETAKLALKEQQAAVSQAEANSRLASVTAARYDKLAKVGYVSQQQADQYDTQLETAKAAAVSAQAAEASAASNLNAMREQVQLANQGVQTAEANLAASHQNVIAAQIQVNSAVEGVRAASSAVAAAQQGVNANKDLLAANISNASRYNDLKQFEQVTAPFSGVITQRFVDTGALIANGNSGGANTLFDISRTNDLRLQVFVPQAYINLIHVGAPITVTVAELPGQSFHATVFSTAGALDPASRTLLTEVHLPNVNDTLHAGMYAEVHFTLPKSRGYLQIPGNALIFDANGTRVATLTSRSTVHFERVKVGRDLGRTIQIISGVSEGTTVITDPSDSLKEGEEVTMAHHAGQ